MSKVSVIGAGNVGATCAHVLAFMNFSSEVVLLDIKEGLAEGKAIDMMQTSRLFGFSTSIRGVTNDYEAINHSNVVVITSGIPRKPGMTREELIGTNAGIVKSVVEQVLLHAPDSIIIVVSNPLDTMTYLALRCSGLPKNRIMGMGGILDSNRFAYYISNKLKVSPLEIESLVIGGHGDTTMIPIARLAKCKGTPIAELLSTEDVEKIINDTMVGGATLTKLIGTSAWYAPGTSAALLVRSILLDEKKLFPCCVSLEGDYGHRDICIGVPAVIGKNGVEKIISLELTPAEKESFDKSVASVHNMNQVLKELHLV